MLDIIFFIIIPLLILIIIFILWIKYGKDSKLNKKISKNPPKLNNILFGYYYRGFINENDIKASLISLIIRGYLNNKNEILKKYDDLDRIDKVILNYISNNKIINNSKLIDEINKNLIIKNDIDNVFEEQSLSKKSSCKFLIFLMYLIIIIKALIHIKKLKYLIIILPLNLIGLKIMISLFDNKKIKYNLLGFIFGLLLIILPLRFLVINKLIGIYKILFIISLIIFNDYIIYFNAKKN